MIKQLFKLDSCFFYDLEQESENASNIAALVSPSPSSGIVTVYLDVNSKVSLYNSQGIEVMSVREVSAQGILNMSE